MGQVTMSHDIPKISSKISFTNKIFQPFCYSLCNTMRPIVLRGHARPITTVKYNRDGDLLITTARDQVPSVWYSSNGERLGTLEGHGGAVFTADFEPTSRYVMTGAADNSIRLWDLQSGKNVITWETKSTCRHVEFSPKADKFLAVTEHQLGQIGTIHIYPVDADDLEKTSAAQPILQILNEGDAKAKVLTAAWTYDQKHIIAGHQDGRVSKYDAETGELVNSFMAHEGAISDLQMSQDKSYFITSSRDKTAKLIKVDELEVMKTYVSEAPLNSAAITPVKDFVILSGGQAARDVTTTSAREGKFESRIFHKIFAEELATVKGHFGPINTVAVHPLGTSYTSGGEEGVVRIHHFDKSYFDFQYDTEMREDEIEAKEGVTASA